MAAKPTRAALQTMVINPLTPILGGRFEILGTPQTPAAFRCTVAANVGRGALHAPRTPQNPRQRGFAPPHIPIPS